MANLYVWLKFFHVLGVGMFLFGHGVSAVASFAVRGRPADAGAGALLRASIRSGAITYPGLLLRHLPSYDEVANIAVFAASDWARTITASEINFTGGAVVD